MEYAIAVVALAALCGGWVVFQRWVAQEMPEAPGINRRCDGCTGDGSCGRPDAGCLSEAGH